MATDINNGGERKTYALDAQTVQLFSNSWKASPKNPEAFLGFFKQRLDFLFGTPNGANLTIQLTYHMIDSIHAAPTEQQVLDNDLADPEFEKIRSTFTESWLYITDTRKGELKKNLMECVDFENFEDLMIDAAVYKKSCDDFTKIYKALLARISDYKTYLQRHADLIQKMADFNALLEKHKKDKLCIAFKDSKEYQAYEKKKKGFFNKISVEQYVEELHAKFLEFYLKGTEDIFDKLEWKKLDECLAKLKKTPDDENRDLEAIEKELAKLNEQFTNSVIRQQKNDEVAAVDTYADFVEDPNRSNKKEGRKNDGALIHFVDGKPTPLEDGKMLSNYGCMGLENLDAFMQRHYPALPEGELSLRLVKGDGMISKSAKALLIKGDAKWGKIKVKVTDPDIYFTPSAFETLFGRK